MVDNDVEKQLSNGQSKLNKNYCVSKWWGNEDFHAKLPHEEAMSWSSMDDAVSLRSCSRDLSMKWR